MKMKRSGKWYRKNEADVMSRLGLEPTPNSGSGWIVKEDGQNDNVICQLKSTDKQTISVSRHDLEKLEYNAEVAHKIPAFVIEFIGTGPYIIVRPELLQDVAKYLSTGIMPEPTEPVLHTGESMPAPNTTMIKSARSSREAFRKEAEAKYNKEKSAK